MLGGNMVSNKLKKLIKNSKTFEQIEKETKKHQAKYFIGVPNMGELKIELVKYLLETIVKYGEDVIIYFRSKQPVDVNRNEIVEDFLESRCEWLLFLDSDMAPRTDLLEMTKHKLPLVSGLTTIMPSKYPIPLLFSKSKNKSSEKYTLITPNEMKNRMKDSLIEVDVVGAGCLLINRKVFLKVKKPYFEFIKDKDGKMFLGEDFNFCEKAKKLGFKIYVDAKHRVGHMKVIDLHGVNEMVSEKVEEALHNIR